MHSVRMDRLQWPQWQRMITQREGTRRRLLRICRENNQAVVAAEVIRFKLHRKSHAAIHACRRIGAAALPLMLQANTSSGALHRHYTPQNTPCL
jgi:hypothetical protein